MTGRVADIEALVAHRGPMLLLDRIVSVSETNAVAEVTMRADNPFYLEGHGVPAYTGLEMMAQAIASIDGMKRETSGMPAKIGFLLGCRRYVANCAMFPVGQVLTISAEMVFGDGAMFAFDCRIMAADGNELARAGMSVYAPDDPKRFLDSGAPNDS